MTPNRKDDMVFYVKAIVSIKIDGISGESEEGVSCLVTNVPNRETAKLKFEDHCRERFKFMAYSGMRFTYKEIAYEI